MILLLYRVSLSHDIGHGPPYASGAMQVTSSGVCYHSDDHGS